MWARGVLGLVSRRAAALALLAALAAVGALAGYAYLSWSASRAAGEIVVRIVDIDPIGGSVVASIENPTSFGFRVERLEVRVYASSGSGLEEVAVLTSKSPVYLAPGSSSTVYMDVSVGIVRALAAVIGGAELVVEVEVEAKPYLGPIPLMEARVSKSIAESGPPG
ncbi:hypothetical protein apy_05160 [Aeropyrum pernix]|uniref:Late embryogenesis abundant protein LEA-2 subgroup domain-containing protein n=1 Tax=Aeropyrum pernix TaxID=56636 RepID=A0A401H8N6_AERPX|nr:hypothetical protein apy_05160 [Aeropyrum pernix]